MGEAVKQLIIRVIMIVTTGIVCALTSFGLACFFSWAFGRFQAEKQVLMARISIAGIMIGVCSSVCLLTLGAPQYAIGANELSVNKSYSVVSEFVHSANGDPYKYNRFAVVADGPRFQIVRLGLPPTMSNYYRLNIKHLGNEAGDQDIAFLTKHSLTK